MTEAEKTVFISYRRGISAYHARAVFMDLREHGYDVFMDVESIDSGTFDTIIINQIEARAHFILILSPRSLERCALPDDWLRREIEYAIDLERNIVPIMISGFQFDDDKAHLTGKLAELLRYNGLTLHHEYFDAAMERLRTRFLKQPLSGTIKHTTTAELQIVNQKIEEIAVQAKPTRAELSAEDYFVQAYTKIEAGDSDGAIGDYTESIRLNPAYHKTYYNRGFTYYDKGDLDAAIKDFTESLSLDPKYIKARYSRGLAYYNKSDFVNAIADFSKVIELEPNRASAYNNRGLAYGAKGSLKTAIEDYTKAVQLDPALTAAYNNRANAHLTLKEIDDAILDYQKYLDLGGGKTYGNETEIGKLVKELKSNKQNAQEIEEKGLRFYLRSLLGTKTTPKGTPIPADLKPLSLPRTNLFPSPIPDVLAEVPGHQNITIDEGGHTRRLPDMETSTDNIKRDLRFGIYSDIGQVRTINQDAAYSLYSSCISADEMPNYGVFIVADGMGGHQDGERASALTVRLVAGYINNNFYMPILGNEQIDADRPTVTEILRSAIQAANVEIMKEVPEGGSTITAAIINGNIAYIGHVGDSRAYLITQVSIEQITRDHSLVQRLIELDQLTSEEAAEHPQRNVLYRAIGQNETVEVDAITRRLPPGARLLLCTDGLWNLIPEEEIRNTVNSSASPQVACESLAKLANARGGPDNISVIVIAIPE